MRTLHYLGPEGTFTHQAAMEAAELLRPLESDFALAPAPDVPAILDAVQTRGDWGVIAWENNIEGYVVPNLDALIDARHAAGFARVGVDVSFDAFIRLPQAESTAGTDAAAAGAPDDRIAQALAACTQVTAHPHGLAQCRRFAAEHGLREHPASSNGAACRDLVPGQVALGPRICGELYGLTRVGTAVEDYPGAHTEFVVIAPRDEVAALIGQVPGRDGHRPRRLDPAAGKAGRADDRTTASADAGVNPSADAGVGHDATPADEYESIIAFIPLSTGPGVLADLLDVLRDAGLNMTSFISRPIKGHDGTYSFIATIDAAPWQRHLAAVLAEVAEHGDWVKTLAVYPRRERPNPPVDAWMLPNGGLHLDQAASQAAAWRASHAARKELLW